MNGCGRAGLVVLAFCTIRHLQIAHGRSDDCRNSSSLGRGAFLAFPVLPVKRASAARTLSRWSRRFSFPVLTLLGALVFGELAARTLLGLAPGGRLNVKALHRLRAAVLANSDMTNPLRDEPGPIGYMAHPYVGYTFTPDEKLKGFMPESVWSLGDPPGQRPAADEFVVGLFGGSVANNVGRAWSALSAPLRDRPDLRGRKLRFISTGTPGHKQPQQLYLMSYLLLGGYRFDVVVNLDGYNEITAGFHNVQQGRNPNYPYYWHDLLTDVRDSRQVSLMGKLLVLREDRRTLAARMSDSPVLDHSAVAAVMWHAWDTWLADGVARTQGQLAALHTRGHRDFVQRGPPYVSRSDPGTVQDLIAIWREASIQMAAIARTKGITYLHVLQPNQYLAGSKDFNTEEAKIALDPSASGAQLVPTGYPEMRMRAAELARAGVDFVDLTQVFRAVAQPVYRDACCHLNDFGNGILAERIGVEIGKRLDGGRSGR